MLKLGVMGGTFDPLHWAHLVMAEEARTVFALDKVLFIPAGQPPHKVGYRISDAEHRYAMALLGTATHPDFEVSRIELDNEGLSYSVDTLRRLKQLYGADTEIYFVVGADEALSITSWHEAENLPGLARFLVAPRPGCDILELETLLPARFADAMDILPMSPANISATALRAKVASGESIRYLVPDSVEAYIRKHALYVLDSTEEI